LTFDAERRDRYGRLLAYVRRAGDGVFVNEQLVRDGYARTLTIPPNVRYAARFATLARDARDAQRGLWHAC
jgi:micrococcal nuclease